jgi:hypothetical protein
MASVFHWLAETFGVIRKFAVGAPSVDALEGSWPPGLKERVV